MDVALGLRAFVLDYHQGRRKDQIEPPPGGWKHDDDVSTGDGDGVSFASQNGDNVEGGELRGTPADGTHPRFSVAERVLAATAAAVVAAAMMDPVGDIAIGIAVGEAFLDIRAGALNGTGAGQASRKPATCTCGSHLTAFQCQLTTEPPTNPVRHFPSITYWTTTPCFGPAYHRKSAQRLQATPRSIHSRLRRDE